MKKKPQKTAKTLAKTRKGAPSIVTPEILDAEFEESSSGDPATEDSDPDLEASDMAASDSMPAVLAGSLTPHREEPTEAVEADAIPAHQEILKRYMSDVSRYSLLTPEEEFALAVKLKTTGDLDAARRMVSANLRLVVKIAMEYRSAYQNVMDLIQEGNIGLMKAVSKFDPNKGAKLSYYASWWIRSYILKYILDNFRLIRVGTTQAQKKLFFHLIREKEKLEAQGLDAGPKLLASKLHVREQDVVEMEQRLSGQGAEMSLTNPVGPAGGGDSKATHMDLLQDHSLSTDDVLAQGELQEILKSRLQSFAKTLKEKELAVFEERLASENPKTLQEVADQFGLTRERARQIEVKVIEKLREFYKQYIR